LGGSATPDRIAAWLIDHGCEPHSAAGTADNVARNLGAPEVAGLVLVTDAARLLASARSALATWRDSGLPDAVTLAATRCPQRHPAATEADDERRAAAGGFTTVTQLAEVL